MNILEYLVPFSASSGIIEGVIIMLVILKLFIDIRDIKKSRQLYRRLVSMAKVSIMERFSVVIELNRKADAVIGLLDHLYNQNYSDLAVIIIIKSSAGKNAKKELENYRRKKKVNGLRIIKQPKGVQLKSILARYVTGTFMINLLPSDRLSDKFFEEICLSSIAYGGPAIEPVVYSSLNNTMISAISTNTDIWRHLALNTTGKVKTSAYIVRPTSRRSMKSIYVDSRNILSQKLSFKNRLIIIMSFAAILTALSYCMDINEIIILGSLLFGIYAFINIWIIVKTKPYTVLDKINLILIIPFDLIYKILLMISTLLSKSKTTKVRQLK